MYDTSIFIMEFQICITHGAFVYMPFSLWTVGRDTSIGRFSATFAAYIKLIQH